MPILGIDYEKCSNCNICLTTCFYLRRDKEKNKVVYNDPMNFCNLCGHCIGRCPEDAIIYEDMGEAYAYEGVRKPETIISYDTLYKFLRANRSTRLYRKKNVPVEILEKVFEAMTHAPTGSNLRSERFTILSNQEIIKKLSDAVQEELLKDPKKQYEDIFPKKQYEDIFSRLANLFRNPIFFDAPHLIIVDSMRDTNSEENNIGIIITYGRLAAQALGVGTCWNGWTKHAMMNNSKIKELAGIKGKRMGLFTIGYPANIKYHRSPPRTPKKVYGLYS